MQPPLQTRDDSMLVKRYVLLPVLLDVLEKTFRCWKAPANFQSR